MKELLSLFVFFTLFVSFGSCWEGTYNWTFDGGDEMYLCEQDGYVMGAYGEIGVIQARITGKNPNFARGRYYGVGDKLGGRRMSYRNFLPNSGKINLTLSDNGTVVSTSWEERRTGIVTTADFAVETTSVSDRIGDCMIIDHNATDTLEGLWQNPLASDSVVWICLDGRSFSASYNYSDTDGDVHLGYGEGYCAQESQICPTDYYESPFNYGTALSVRLSNGSYVSFFVQGPASEVDISSLRSLGLAGRTSPYPQLSSSVTSEQCVQFDTGLNPRKCRSFNATDCQTNDFFCEIDDTQDPPCVQVDF